MQCSNTPKIIVTKCYGIEKEWDSRDMAMDYFIDAMMHSEGAEYERYELILYQLLYGFEYCTDEVDISES